MKNRFYRMSFDIEPRVLKKKRKTKCFSHILQHIIIDQFVGTCAREKKNMINKCNNWKGAKNFVHDYLYKNRKFNTTINSFLLASHFINLKKEKKKSKNITIKIA